MIHLFKLAKVRFVLYVKHLMFFCLFLREKYISTYMKLKNIIVEISKCIVIKIPKQRSSK